MSTWTLTLEPDRETDGLIVAEVPELGLFVYGRDPDDALARVLELASRVVADKAARGELELPPGAPLSITFRDRRAGIDPIGSPGMSGRSRGGGRPVTRAKSMSRPTGEDRFRTPAGRSED